MSIKATNTPMNTENQKNTDPIQALFKMNGLESPGSDFHLTVLKKLESLQTEKIIYKPVISSLGWKFIMGFIAAIFGSSILLAPGTETPTPLFKNISEWKLPILDFSLFNFSFPMLDFSPQFSTGILAFSILGFIMILGTLRKNMEGV